MRSVWPRVLAAVAGRQAHLGHDLVEPVRRRAERHAFGVVGVQGDATGARVALDLRGAARHRELRQVGEVDERAAGGTYLDLPELGEIVALRFLEAHAHVVAAALVLEGRDVEPAHQRAHRVGEGAHRHAEVGGAIAVHLDLQLGLAQLVARACVHEVRVLAHRGHDRRALLLEHAEVRARDAVLHVVGGEAAARDPRHLAHRDHARLRRGAAQRLARALHQRGLAHRPARLGRGADVEADLVDARAAAGAHRHEHGLDLVEAAQCASPTSCATRLLSPTPTPSGSSTLPSNSLRSASPEKAKGMPRASPMPSTKEATATPSVRTGWRSATASQRP